VNAPATGSAPSGPKRSKALGVLLGAGVSLFVIAGVMLVCIFFWFWLSLAKITSQLSAESDSKTNSAIVVGTWHPHSISPPKTGTKNAAQPTMDAKTEKALKDAGPVLDSIAQSFDRLRDFEFHPDGTYVLTGVVKTEGTYRVEGNQLYLTPKRVGGHAPLYTYAEQDPISISPDGKSFVVLRWNTRWEKADH
jgi:hypothetical protein